MARMMARCMRCGIEGFTKDMIKSACDNRGNGKHAYLCVSCATENDRYRSNRTMEEIGGVFDGFRFGIEFETIGSTYYFRNMMCRFGFTPTHDCSLTDDCEHGETYFAYGDTETSCEYVSATNMGMKRFSKQFIEFERCLRDGEVYMDDTCGTHCHISYHNMENGEMAKIREYFESLFIPMQNVMLANPEKTTKLFGRYFDDNDITGEWNDEYCPTIRSDNKAQDCHRARYCWLNATNDSNLEFRINRFLNAKQMRECIMFEKWLVKCIVKNFTAKYTDDDVSNLVNAHKTATKLARKLDKIFAEM